MRAQAKKKQANSVHARRCKICTRCDISGPRAAVSSRRVDVGFSKLSGSASACTRWWSTRPAHMELCLSEREQRDA